MKFSSKVARNSCKLQLGGVGMGSSNEFCKGYMEYNWLKWKSSEYQLVILSISNILFTKEKWSSIRHYVRFPVTLLILLINIGLSWLTLVLDFTMILILFSGCTWVQWIPFLFLDCCVLALSDFCFLLLHQANSCQSPLV